MQSFACVLTVGSLPLWCYRDTLWWYVEHAFRNINEVAECLLSMCAYAYDVLQSQTLDGVDTHAKENSLSPDEFKQVSYCYYYTTTLYSTLHSSE
jgi:hypothetical protein